MSVATAAATSHETRAPAQTRARRILYIEANEDGTVGGSHQALFDLVRTLDRTRYEPVVLFYQRNRYTPELQKLGIETLDFEEVRAREKATNATGTRAARLLQLGTAIRVRGEFLRAHRIDMIHMNNSPKVGSDDWLPAARLRGIPCIANVMGDARGERTPARKWLFRQFSHYLPISAYIADAMEGHGITRARMDLIYLGVDIEAFRARITRTRAGVRGELGVPEDAVLAVMVGNIREWKGQHVVVEAVTRMRPELRDRLHVVFAGAATPADREFAERLDRSVREAGLEMQLRFLGARTDVPDLLNAADFAVHASILPEPFGLVVTEAMAAGRAVLAANTGGPAEIVAEGSGMTYDPAHPEQLTRLLEQVVADPALLSSLGDGARQRAEQFTVRAYTEGVQRVYRKMLNV